VVVAQLHESQVNYRTMVEQIPIITYIASLESPGKLLYLSPQIQQLGYPLDEWLTDPQGLLKWVHADDRSGVIDAYARTYEYHVPLRCEYQLISSDGLARWFLDEAKVVCGEAGGISYLQGVLVDITKDKETEQELFYYRRRLEDLVTMRTQQLEIQCTILNSANANLGKVLFERRQLEAELRVREAHLRHLLESTCEGILGVNTEGRCTFINKSALAMLGYAHEELLGRDAHATIHQSCSDGFPVSAEQWLIYSALRGGNSQSSTEIFRYKDGGSFLVECSAYPMQIDMQVTGAVLIFRDATESLYYQATHDALTGLINRTEFERRVTRVLANAHANKSEHVLCYLELDPLKIIKDTCGHAARDELMRKVASLLQSRLRQRDTIAFFGGEEFSLLLEHCTLDQAWTIVNEFCESMRDYYFTWDGNSFSVGVSIGIAALTNDDEDVAAVLRVAYSACYMAKKGHNQVHIFRSQDDQAAKS
jgi:diguanylate cyclase